MSSSRGNSIQQQKRPSKQQQQTYESDVEDVSDDQLYEPPQRQRKQNMQMQRQRQGGSGPLDQIGPEGVGRTAGGAVSGVTDTLGDVAGNAIEKKDSGKSDTLRLRLDLNLDVEVTLKAKIHGDLELALLN